MTSTIEYLFTLSSMFLILRPPILRIVVSLYVTNVPAKAPKLVYPREMAVYADYLILVPMI